MRPWQRHAGLGAACVAVALGGVLSLGALSPAKLPDPQSWGTHVVARDGSLLALAPAPGGVWRFETAPNEVSPFLRALLIAVEDRHFATEPGVDPGAVPARRLADGVGRACGFWRFDLDHAGNSAAGPDAADVGRKGAGGSTGD